MTGKVSFLSPTLLARGETVEILPERESTEYHRLRWRGELYECLPQDLLASSAPRVIPATPDEEPTAHVVEPAALKADDYPHIAQLAYQLANGAAIKPGDRIPVGWNADRERVFIEVTTEMLAEASVWIGAT